MIFIIFIIFYLQMVFFMIFLIVLNFSQYLTINFTETLPHRYQKGDLNPLQLNNLFILVSYYFKLISIIFVLFIILLDSFYFNLFLGPSLITLILIFILILIILKLLYLFPLILSLGLNFYLTFYHFSTLIHHYLLHHQPQ